jgi:putative membrane protein
MGSIVAAVFSALHLLSLALGLGGVWARGRALRSGSIEGVLRADNAWGIAALGWLATGLTRAFGGVEKPAAWYTGNPLFWAKIGLFVLVVGLELWPMVTFIRWRIARGRGQAADTRHVPLLIRINDVELGLTVTIVFVAAMMARRVAG